MADATAVLRAGCRFMLAGVRYTVRGPVNAGYGDDRWRVERDLDMECSEMSGTEIREGRPILSPFNVADLHEKLCADGGADSASIRLTPEQWAQIRPVIPPQPVDVPTLFGAPLLIVGVVTESTPYQAGWREPVQW